MKCCFNDTSQVRMEISTKSTSGVLDSLPAHFNKMWLHLWRLWTSVRMRFDLSIAAVVRRLLSLSPVKYLYRSPKTLWNISSVSFPWSISSVSFFITVIFGVTKMTSSPMRQPSLASSAIIWDNSAMVCWTNLRSWMLGTRADHEYSTFVLRTWRRIQQT